MRMFSEMASSFYSTVSLVTEKLTNFKAAIYIEMKSLYTFTAAPINKQIHLVSTCHRIILHKLNALLKYTV